MPTIQTTLAGLNFRPIEARAVFAALSPGASLSLEAEPFNQYDAYAVKIITEGEHIGYIASGMNIEVAAALAEGIPVTCTLKEKGGGRNRPVIILEWPDPLPSPLVGDPSTDAEAPGEARPEGC